MTLDEQRRPASAFGDRPQIDPVRFDTVRSERWAGVRAVLLSLFLLVMLLVGGIRASGTGRTVMIVASIALAVVSIASWIHAERQRSKRPTIGDATPLDR